MPEESAHGHVPLFGHNNSALAPTGAALIDLKPDKIHFTGSTRAGKQITAAAPTPIEIPIKNGLLFGYSSTERIIYVD